MLNRVSLDQSQKTIGENHAKTDNPISTLRTPNSDVIPLADLSAFCVDVYNDLNDKKNLPELPPGWNRSLHTDIFRGGFYAACYYKDLGDHYDIVVAYRGTVPTSPDSVREAFQIYEKNSLQIFENAKNFYYSVLDEFADDQPQEPGDESGKLHNSTIVFTGHSMGGVLADFSSILTGVWDTHKSITFDNPGSKPSIVQWCIEIGFEEDQITYRLEALAKSCHAYQSNVNVVNTCHEQAGGASRLDLPYNIYGASPAPVLPSEIKLPYLLNLHYTLGYSLRDQHSIVKIHQYLKENKSITEANYPNNLQAGYAAYLDYEARTDYWSQYIKVCWDLNPEQRIWYLNDFEKFSNDLVKQIKTAHAGAASMIPKPSIDLEQKSSPFEVHASQQKISASNLGMFASNNNETSKQSENSIDTDDFVMVEKSEKAPQPDDSTQTTRCLIM